MPLVQEQSGDNSVSAEWIVGERSERLARPEVALQRRASQINERAWEDVARRRPHFALALYACQYSLFAACLPAVSTVQMLLVFGAAR